MATSFAQQTRPIFDPLETGNLRLKNRIAMAPMTRFHSPDGIPNDDKAAYYAKRAEGGVGLIITEGTYVHPTGNGYHNIPRFYGEDALAGWKSIADSVSQYDCKIFPQLWHVGSIRKSTRGPVEGLPALAPSAVKHPSFPQGDTPQEMNRTNIKEIIHAFTDAAQNAQRLGFQGIELHGAHGYLIDQFFWEATNQRTDEYGGDLSQRTRFAVELVESIRSNTTEDFVIMFRFSQWKQGDYEHKMAKSPQELESFLMPLLKSGVDIFHCSTRRFYEPEFEDSNLNLAGWTKKITGACTCTVGSIGLTQDFLSAFYGKDRAGKSAQSASIDSLLERFNAGEFDLFAVGRALISDPKWPEKIKEGRFSEIQGFDARDLDHLI